MSQGLTRRFGLVQATALNMVNMIGVGPFITIPLLLSTLGGPQAMLGWVVGLIVAVCDGLVWAELGAAMPGSGGSFGYLREAFAGTRVARLVPFLFVWQFIFSGPLEIASGYLGFARYASYIWPGLAASPWRLMAVAATVGVVNIALLYRRIDSIATVTVGLWAGAMLTTVAVIAAGVTHFDPRVAFDVPPGAFTISRGFFFNLGAAAAIAVYDYLGYYDICYIGEEVRDPGRVIPRSIVVSTLLVAVIYFGINLSIIGVVPWRTLVPADAHPESFFVASAFMERIYGSGVARAFTGLVLWTAFGSVFALLLGYSRIPYAAALSGFFFRPFARLHPTKGFPHVSVLVLGLVSILASTLSLDTVIAALVATRILVQFIGQAVGLVRLRQLRPDLPRPYRVWAYPIPVAVALAGWLFIFATTEPRILLFSLATLALGGGTYFFLSSSSITRENASNA